MASGLPVWGGEIIIHLRNGLAESCDGEYYILPSPIDPAPKLTRGQAFRGPRRRPFPIRPRARRRSERARDLPGERHGVPPGLQALGPQSRQADVQRDGPRRRTTGKVFLHFSNIQDRRPDHRSRHRRAGGTPSSSRRTSTTAPITSGIPAVARPFTQKNLRRHHQYGRDDLHILDHGQFLGAATTSSTSMPTSATPTISTTTFGLKGPNNANMPLTSFRPHLFGLAGPL